MKNQYLTTLQAIATRLEAVGNPLDQQQSAIVADVLAHTFRNDALMATIDAQMAVVDADRNKRLERRLQDRRQQHVPVAEDRRQADRRAGVDRRARSRTVDALEPASEYTGPSDAEIAQRLAPAVRSGDMDQVVDAERRAA